MNKTSITGDALSHPTGLIVHGCNCQGVMGSGIAKSVRERFPKAYEEYLKEFTNRGLTLGQVMVVEVAPEKYICNAMTQNLFGTDARQVNYEAVARCFEKVRKIAKVFEDTHGYAPDVVYPLIGAGLGGGNWNIIDKIIDETLGDDVKKVVYHFKA